LCLICWAFPIKTLASTADQPKPKILVVAVHHDNYTSIDIIIKDNAIVHRAPTELSLLEPPIHKPAPAQSERDYSGKAYTKEEVQQLIRDYSARYGISADLPLRIARCESGFNQFSKNRNSTASGVFQWLASSWRNQPASVNGTVSVFDADANVSAAVWLIAHAKISPWNASRSCWSK
jgi:hypothetical protein